MYKLSKSGAIDMPLKVISNDAQHVRLFQVVRNFFFFTQLNLQVFFSLTIFFLYHLLFDATFV